jgi:SAM-dependent methyltransferase
MKDKPIGQDYYLGDDYTDYVRQTDPTPWVELVRQYCQGGKLLDVGCALGVYAKAFNDAGFDAYGVDISEFAVREAAKRIGADHVKQCNVDKDDIPFPLKFDVFWLWDSLEHFADPDGVLRKVDAHAATGARLFMHTCNHQSLLRLLQGKDWEGYADYSHYGADRVSASSIRRVLGELGWDIESWRCAGIWTNDIDPVLRRMRDVFQNLPELTTFLQERDLGDLVQVVARKR